MTYSVKSIDYVREISNIKLFVYLGHVTCKRRPYLRILYLHLHGWIYESCDERLRLQWSKCIMIQGKRLNCTHYLWSILIEFERPCPLEEVKRLDNLLLSGFALDKVFITKEYKHLIGIQVMKLDWVKVVLVVVVDQYIQFLQLMIVYILLSVWLLKLELRIVLGQREVNHFQW